MTAPTHHKLIIIGAGMSGVAMAAKLKMSGDNNFIVIEKSPDLGGTWLDNRYPGAQCDVRSHLYSYSFARNPNWSRRYADAQEIHAYVDRCADQFKLKPHFRFGNALVSACWQNEQLLWLLTLDNGTSYTCEHLVCSSAPLNEPQWPNIIGLKNYQGQLLHTARWNPHFSFHAKRVAVIGTAASAVQAIPELAQVAGTLTVYQRTPNWVVPRADKAYAGWQKKLFSIPPVANALRGWLYLYHEVQRLGFTKDSAGSKTATKTALKHLHKQVASTELRNKLTPNYALGCKRVLLSDTYYPALQRTNVTVQTKAIRQITPLGIQTTDGQEHAFDAIVCATGFDLEAMSHKVDFKGIGGISLQEQWARGPMAYKGTCVEGMPNFYMLLGPNTATGHTSTLLYIEAQIGFILRTLKELHQREASAIVLKTGAMQTFDAGLQAQMKTTVWSGSCASWYKKETANGGRIVALWPGFTGQFKKMLARESYQNFQFFSANKSAPSSPSA